MHAASIQIEISFMEDFLKRVNTPLIVRGTGGLLAALKKLMHYMALMLQSPLLVSAPFL